MLDLIMGAEDLDLDDVVGEGSALADVSEHWVTITTGSASWINCQNQNTQRTVYFPIGLVLRPVRDVRIDSQDRTIFQTEYGLNVIIDNRAVAPVTAEGGFVFADGNAVYAVCKPGAVGCEARREFRPKAATGADWPYFSGNKGYLFTSNIADLEAAAEELSALRAVMRTSPEAATPPDFSEHPACQGREAWFYRPFRRFDPDAPDKDAEYPRPVTYTLCSLDPQGNVIWRRVKIVTPESAAAKFEGLWAVSTLRVPDAAIVDSLKEAVGYDAPIVSYIPCGEARGAGLKTIGDLVLSPFNQGEVVNLSDEILAERTNFELHVRAYETHVGLSQERAIFQAPLYQDLELEVLCDDDLNVDAPGTVRIHAAPIFGRRPLAFSFAELDRDYDRLFNSYGRPPPASAKLRLTEGRLFRICEFIEYVNWRTLLRQRFLSQPSVTDAAEVLDVEALTIADHVAHLMMATFFFTEAKMITERGEDEGCPS